MELMQEKIIVSAGNPAGIHFIQSLLSREIPFAVLISRKNEQEEMNSIGVPLCVEVDLISKDSWIIPEFNVGRVFLFEDSLPLCCRYIQICRSWTGSPIYVISQRGKPRLIYRGLGADHVIHSHSDDLSFLL
ncbi:hypothetical protein [Paenibacillus sp. Marseille-Q4541]|uniref:hypothetical protein n=1 Tax=Paenibacillus sp. Marseille-Q4541 TaxID=2831522 RepID=UPI001BA96C3D|nr:hypothetical protein [Paenibacillus sp. Marseille-Q4541]